MQLDEAYRQAIAVHYPGVDDMTMAVRVELMKKRDQLSSAMRVCCDDAYPTLSEGLRLAGVYALSGAPLARLLLVNAAVGHMIECARMLQKGEGLG